MAGPSTALSPVIAASTHWLVRAYPATGTDQAAGTLNELQARQAVTVAAWLRYPTPVDAELVAMAGPGGSAVLDWRMGSEPDDEMAEDEGWRTWVDEVVVSWAACLLADPLLAARAVNAVAAAIPQAPAAAPAPAGEVATGREGAAVIPGARPAGARPAPRRRSADLPAEFRRLTAPDPRESVAAALLRHPDLLDSVAGMHRDDLLYLLPDAINA